MWCKLTWRNDRVSNDHDPLEAFLLRYASDSGPLDVLVALFPDVVGEAVLEEQEAACLSQYGPGDCDAQSDAWGIGSAGARVMRAELEGGPHQWGRPDQR